jgi:hypothetical protein
VGLWLVNSESGHLLRSRQLIGYLAPAVMQSVLQDDGDDGGDGGDNSGDGDGDGEAGVPKIGVTKYRWVILFVFSLQNFVNSIMWICFGTYKF